MKNNDSKKQNIINTSKEGIRIVKMAAFCFAIISWIATAEGFTKYIFTEARWQALLVSFAIQSILFVFNLKLPEYFSKIEIKKYKKEEARFIWRKLRNSVVNVKGLFAVFYVAVLISSSWFSYVYISNATYKSTRYIDANIDLDSNYRKFLYETQSYAKEYEEYLKQNIGVELAELFGKKEDNQTFTDSNGETMDQNFTDINTSGMSEVELDQDISKQNSDVKNYRREYQLAKADMKLKRDEYNEAKALNVSSDIIEKAKAVYEKALKKMESIRKNLDKAADKLDKLQRKRNSINASDSFLSYKFWKELGKDEPKEEELNQYAEELYELVINSGANDFSTSTFSDVVGKTFFIRSLTNKYCSIKKSERDIEQYISKLISEEIIIPEGDESSDSDSVNQWKKQWKNRYSKLEKTVKALYAVTIEQDSQSTYSNVEASNKYAPQSMVDEMDNLQRKYILGNNEMERAINLFGSRYKFMAIFSALFAVFLDVASLLAGLFIYYMKKKNYDKKVNN